MKLLIDTHIWIWSLLEPKRLSSRIADALESPENSLYLSPISVWEFLLLVEKGRVEIDQEPGAWVTKVLAELPLLEAPLDFEIASDSRRVPLSHPDPADRFLAATARIKGLTLVTADERLLECPDLETLTNT